jgi:hypothetical protein
MTCTWMYNKTKVANYMLNKVFLFCILFALLVLSPAPIHAWEYVGNSLIPVSLPPQGYAVNKTVQTDFDGDGLEESLVIRDGRALILTGTLLRWESPSEWNVTQAGVGDLNHDGSVEAVLLVWRPFNPWKVERWLPSGGRIDRFQNDEGESCHIILIGWRKNMFRERWAGSALAEPVNTLAMADMNRDGLDELVTLDSTYSASPSAPAKALKVWEWNGFGFSLVSQVEGLFSDLQVIQTSDNRVIILTQ